MASDIVIGQDRYTQMRNLMRGAGVHFPPWSKLTTSERWAWHAIMLRAVVDPPEDGQA